MTCAGRKEGCETAVRRAFNIPDVYVYPRCRIPSAAPGSNRASASAGCSRPPKSFRDTGARTLYRTQRAEHYTAGVREVSHVG